MNECIGFWGRLFGHRFVHMTNARYDYCARCGFRPYGGDQ